MNMIFPVTSHTDHVGRGTTFVAVKGFKHDGVSFIEDALKKGASKIVITHDQYSPEREALCQKYNAALLCVDDTRKALATLSAEATGHAHKKLKIIGVTGTKGKTTTAFLLHHILQKSDHKTALISTICTKIGSEVTPAQRTTPESDYLHFLFQKCVEKNITHVVMEVSSHALSLDRVHGLTFDGAVFTNLGRDHLDFHETMEQYLEAKMMLFNMIKPGGIGVMNADNEWCKNRIRSAAEQAKNYTLISVGQEQTSDAHEHYRLSIVDATCDGIELCLMAKPPLLLESRTLAGVFNAYNVAMAATICKHLEIAYTQISKAVGSFTGVPGRMQKHTLTNGALGFVDFAHEPTSMEAVLNLLRPFTQHLIVVFGCGGDRNPQRRSLMGNCAARLADTIIVTSDNPRSEDPNKIIDEIIEGIAPELRGKIERNVDRAEAIQHAAALSKNTSIIAVLGKGHETYQIIGDKQIPFDDMQELKKY